MKKVMLSGLTLLSILTLAACSSGNKDSNASDSKAETTQTTGTKEIKGSTATYLTDEEIEAIQTVGDYKKSFKSLMDSYVADFDAMLAQLPEDVKEELSPQRDKMVESINEQYKVLEEEFADSGANDDTALPAESRETMVSALKTSRDMLKSAMDGVYQQVQSMIKE